MDLNAMLELLASAENQLCAVMYERPGNAHPDIEGAHRAVSEALHMINDYQAHPRCGLSGCDQPVIYSGTGRRPIYCSDRCRFKAARQRKRTAA